MEEQGAACPLFHPLGYIAPRSAGQLSEEIYVNARLDAFWGTFNFQKEGSPLRDFMTEIQHQTLGHSLPGANFQTIFVGPTKAY